MTASRSAAVVAGMALDAMKRGELDQVNQHGAADKPTQESAADAKAAAVRRLRVLIHTALTKRAEILKDEAFRALDVAQSPAERLEIVNRFFEEFALEIDILEATTGEPPRTAAARAAAERGRHLRSSIDPVARYVGRRLILAAHAPAPARRLAADLRLPMNRPRVVKASRDAAIVQMARDSRYAGKAGKPFADAVASDLKLYAGGEWRFEQVCTENPYQSGWRAAAWEVLKASPSYWVSERKAPWHWRTIFRVLEQNGLVTNLD